MIGNRLKELRKKHRYTQKEIGAMCGVSDISVYKCETDKTEPNIDTLCKLADIYNVSIDYLLGRTPMAAEVKEQSPPALAEGEAEASFTLPDGKYSSIAVFGVSPSRRRTRHRLSTQRL